MQADSLNNIVRTHSFLKWGCQRNFHLSHPDGVQKNICEMRWNEMLPDVFDDAKAVKS